MRHKAVQGHNDDKNGEKQIVPRLIPGRQHPIVRYHELQRTHRRRTNLYTKPSTLATQLAKQPACSWSCAGLPAIGRATAASQRRPSTWTPQFQNPKLLANRESSPCSGPMPRYPPRDPVGGAWRPIGTHRERVDSTPRTRDASKHSPRQRTFTSTMPAADLKTATLRQARPSTPLHRLPAVQQTSARQYSGAPGASCAVKRCRQNTVRTRRLRLRPFSSESDSLPMTDIRVVLDRCG